MTVPSNVVKFPPKSGKAKRMTLADFAGAADAMSIQFARHRHSGRIYLRHGAEAWQAIQGFQESSLRGTFEENLNRQMSQDRFRVFSSLLADKIDLDPFEDWLEDAVNAPTADTGPDIETWACELWGVEDTAFNRFAQRCVFVAPVLLAMNPGARVRIVPVLVGEAGSGKSTFAEHILPEHLREPCFTPSLALDDDRDSTTRALRGKVIAVMEEMRGLRRAGWATLKDLTTQTDMRLIEKYSENESRYLRTWSFLGCSNPGLSLPGDPVARERFLPIELPKRRATEDPVTWLERHRGRLFKLSHEYIVRDGIERLDVPDTLAEARAAAAERFADPTDIELLAGRMAGKFLGFEYVTSHQVQKVIDDEHRDGERRITMRAIGPYLRRCGWTNKVQKLDGKTARVWLPPEALNP